MAAEIFRAISNLRFALDTETDADSPDNETTFAAIREAVEILYKLLLSTGTTGTLTSDPPNDATGEAEDTGAGFTDDEHNGRTLIFTDGNAKGNFYTIDDTVAADNAVYCTGDNLYADGARSGDAYEILYDIKTNTTGHNHDDVNSAPVNLEDGTVQALYWDYAEGTEHTTVSDSWDVKRNGKIYVPANAEKLVMECRIKSNNVGVTCSAGFSVDGNDATAATRAATTYAWPSTPASLDCSGIAEGIYDFELQIKSSAAGNTCYLQGYHFRWENN